MSEPKKQAKSQLFVTPSRVKPKRKKHLSECYISRYPQDAGVYCTCDDNSPEV
jgi:hypothetical protein